MHTAPGACLLYATGAVNLEHSSRLSMIQDHMVLMVQDHVSRGQNLKKQ